MSIDVGNFLMMAGFFLTFIVVVWRMNVVQIKRIDALFAEFRSEFRGEINAVRGEISGLREEINDLRKDVNNIDRRLSRVEGILQTLPLLSSFINDITPTSSVNN